MEQGGTVDRSRVPDVKPALEQFFVDDRKHLWVQPVASSDEALRVFDVFDPEGRYLGRVRSGVRIVGVPVFRGDHLYAVSEDVDHIPYGVRARIVRP